MELGQNVYGVEMEIREYESKGKSENSHYLLCIWSKNVSIGKMQKIEDSFK